MVENYKALANAIIMQAVKDFRTAYGSLPGTPGLVSGDSAFFNGFQVDHIKAWKGWSSTHKAHFQ
jgi:hypothetical protein